MNEMPGKDRSRSDPRPTVLVVDDEPGLADLYAAWLGERYATRVAYDGEEALRKLDPDIDVVLLDRRMPGFSGDEVLAEIGERELDTLVAMVTAVEPDFDVIGMGFDDYLVKPVSQDELLGIVESLLDRRHYDEKMTELFSLLSKRAALKAQKSEAELERSEEYGELIERIRTVKADADGLVRDLSASNAEEMYRRLDAGEGSDA